LVLGFAAIQYQPDIKVRALDVCISRLVFSTLGTDDDFSSAPEEIQAESLLRLRRTAGLRAVLLLPYAQAQSFATS
jgi:hypothetical protein